MDLETLRNRIDREWGYRVAEELRVRDLKNMTSKKWLDTLPFVHHVGEPKEYLFQAAADVQKELHKRDITFCFIGGVPLQRWGEIRQTEDVDLTIFCELGEELNVFNVLDSILDSRIENPRDMVRFGRMFLGRTSKDVQVDISIGFTPYERRMMERAMDIDYGVDVNLHICCAEDLVVTKSIAGRGQDWVDIHRVIQRSGESMDWDLVYEELKPILDLCHRPENFDRLKKMVGEEL